MSFDWDSIQEKMHLLGHFTQCTSLLAEVDNDTYTTSLRGSYTFFNREDEVRLARANIRAEDIGTIALVMNTETQLLRGVAHVLRVADYMRVRKCSREASMG